MYSKLNILFDDIAGFITIYNICTSFCITLIITFELTYKMSKNLI